MMIQFDTRVLYSFLVPVLAFGAPWVLAAFYEWTWDCAAWNSWTRFVVAAVWAFLLYLLGSVVFDAQRTRQNHRAG